MCFTFPSFLMTKPSWIEILMVPDIILRNYERFPCSLKIIQQHRLLSQNKWLCEGPLFYNRMWFLIFSFIGWERDRYLSYQPSLRAVLAEYRPSVYFIPSRAWGNILQVRPSRFVKEVYLLHDWNYPKTFRQTVRLRVLRLSHDV